MTIACQAGATIRDAAAYTGPAGAKGGDFRIESASGSRFVARTSAPLAPYEGFTVAVSWPKGFVAPPSEGRKALWLARDNAPAIVAWLGLGLVAAYDYRTWTKVGRDPEAGVIVPLFRPPEGLSPAAGAMCASRVSTTRCSRRR